MISPGAFGGATLKRIEWLTLALGGAGAVWASWYWGWRGGAGLALGAVLSWINFRWLKGSVQAFANVAVAQAPPSGGSTRAAGPQALPPTLPQSVPQPPSAGSAQVVVGARVPVSAYLKFFGRFALLLGTVYVILTRSWLPAVAVLAGLFAAAAAVVLGLVFELVVGGLRPTAGSTH